MEYAYSTALEQKQTQKLSLQAIESINLLPLTTFELSNRIYEEIEKNPALEIAKEADFSDFSDKISKLKEKTRLRKKSDEDFFQVWLENTTTKEETLQEHLLSQLAEIDLPNEERDFAEKIIQNINENGFFYEPPQNLFFEVNQNSTDKLSPSQEKLLQKTLKLVQSFEPLGVACNNLQESLVLQAKAKNCSDLVLFLLQEHFELLENPRVSAICKKIENVSAKQIEQALDFIRSLNPFPARQFATRKTDYIVPDVYVYKNKIDSDSFDKKNDEIFSVVIASDFLPTPELSMEFCEFAKGDKKDETVKYAKEKINEAKWFLQSLENREKTLLKVAKAIVKKQNSFFLGLSKVPNPLRLKDIALECNVHETTVSRIVNGKFLQCAQGIFELRYFFTNSIEQNNSVKTENSNISKEAVKEEIKKILAEFEQSEKNLSDSKLATILAEKGMAVARRTVAKYRAELNIASSYDRR